MSPRAAPGATGTDLRPATAPSPDAGRLRLLGPVRLTGRDGEVRLGNRERVVLAVLALAEGDPVDGEALVDAVWGEDPPPSARNSLQVAATKLRRALAGSYGGTAALEWSGRGYALHLPAPSVDAVQFRRAVDEVRAAQRLGALREAGRVADAALVLWPRGPALADARDCVSVAQRAYELEELRRLTVVPAAVQGALDEGRDAEVVDLLRREGGDTDDDAVTGWLALALYRSGHEEEALDVLRAHRRRLAEDGLDARPALLDLERDVLNHAPALDRTAAVVGAGRPRPLPPPQDVLGRD